MRSDNVSYLTPDGVLAMWNYGVTHVIDLRSESEIAKFPSPFAAPEYGPEYLHRPLLDDAMAPDLAEVPSMSDRYLMMLERRQGAIGDIFKAIADVEGPVVFHCYAGKDRTGLVAAMMRPTTPRPTCISPIATWSGWPQLRPSAWKQCATSCAAHPHGS